MLLVSNARTSRFEINFATVISRRVIVIRMADDFSVIVGPSVVRRCNIHVPKLLPAFVMQQVRAFRPRLFELEIGFHCTRWCLDYPWKIIPLFLKQCHPLLPFTVETNGHLIHSLQYLHYQWWQHILDVNLWENTPSTSLV